MKAAPWVGLRSELADALRGLRSRRAATAVALAGLMVALAVGLLVAMLAWALAESDPAIPAPERLVLLDFKGNPPGEPSPWFMASPVAFGLMLKARGLPLELISRVAPDGIDINHQGRMLPAFKLMADPDLVTLLGLRSLAGDLRAALSDHQGIAISVELLHRLWGDLPPAQALGRRIESRGTFYTVLAVMPDMDPRAPLWPGNPMVGKALALVGFDSQGNGWTEEQREAIYVANGRVFARLQPGAQVQQVGSWMREAFRANPRYAQLPADWREGREAAYFRAVPAADWPFEGELNELRWQLLGAVAAASALLLLLAAVNTMNLQAASLLQRQRETALRRSLGADGLQLLRLWALEAALPLLLAGAAAMLLAWWVAPAVAGWIGLPPEHPVADPVPGPLWLGWVLALLVLLPATLALPAAAALRRAPAPALQGRTVSEGPWGRRVRQGLLAVQLGGALLLLSLAGVMAVQQQHLLSADRGFETRNRLWLGVMVNPDFIPDLGPFLAALGQHPAVSHWAFSNVRPAGDTRGQTELHLSPGGQRQVLRVTTVSPSFFATYGMTLLAGQPELGGGEQRVVIDAKAARLLGFASPQAALGALLRGGGDFLQAGELQRRVVAVVADVKMESARAQPLPQAFVLTDQPQWDLTVHGPDLAAVRAAVEAVWAAHGPPVPHDTRSADELRADVYQQEAQITMLLAGIALLTVGVAMLGAYALVADTVRRRRTELVLRRLHGAGDAAIVAQLVRDFALPLLLALAVALPLAAWLGQGYLADFVERVGPVEGLLLPLAMATLLTGLATVVAAWRHARLALRLQPIEALR